MHTRRTDVLVVGAGSAGAAAARFFAERGRSVLLVDKRERGATGARWVNLVPRWCFERAGIRVPCGHETPLGDGAHAMHLVAPGGRARVSMPPAPTSVHVDMRRFVDRLVDEAIAAGAQLVQGRAVDVELRRGRVRRVVLEVGSSRLPVSADLVVDASGIGGAIRRRVLAERCPEPAPLDVCAAAQYQHDVRDRRALASLLARHGAAPGDSIAFSGIAGGYSTLTLFTDHELSQVGVLAGSIPALGVPNGAELHERFASATPWLGAARGGGAGAIPVRRPYGTLGGAGVALVGDAACQVYGSHGSGVGMGLLAARALADACAGASDPGSDSALRRYARAFHGAHGGLLAGSDAFRRFVQARGARELDAIFEVGLLEPALAASAVAQRPTAPELGFFLRSVRRALTAPRTTAAFLPVALRTVTLERLGALGGLGAFDRVIATLVGASAARRDAIDWALPDAVA
jgi:flavin-dependent dehydrogenase